MTDTTLAVFLSLKGQAEEALTFYQELFKGQLLFKISNQQFKERLDPDLIIPQGEEHFISHSVLQIGGTQLNIVDNPVYPGMPTTSGLSFSVTTGSIQEAEQLYRDIMARPNAEAIALPTENEFAEFYAIIKDPFGVLIQISREKQPDPNLKG